MKTKLFALVALVVAAACSAPKYTYNFSYYDYQTGKRAAQKETEPTVNPKTVEANIVTTPQVEETVAAPVVESKKDFASMTKAEQKTFVKEVKRDVKKAVREVKKMKTVQSAQAMDRDLKMAAIFGAVGIVLGALFSVSNILGFAGAVCIIIGLVFLIKWLMRQ